MTHIGRPHLGTRHAGRHAWVKASARSRPRSSRLRLPHPLCLARSAGVLGLVRAISRSGADSCRNPSISVTSCARTQSPSGRECAGRAWA